MNRLPGTPDPGSWPTSAARRTMTQDFAQRRRVAVALAITVIAVPAAFLLNRGDESSAAPPVHPDRQRRRATGPTADGRQLVERSLGDRRDGNDPGRIPRRHGCPTRANDPATIAIPRLAAVDPAAPPRSVVTSPTSPVCQARGVPFNTADHRDQPRQQPQRAVASPRSADRHPTTTSSCTRTRSSRSPTSPTPRRRADHLVTHSRPRIHELLAIGRLAPRRDLGQNFVADPNTVRRIAALAERRPRRPRRRDRCRAGIADPRARRDRGRRDRGRGRSRHRARIARQRWGLHRREGRV